MIVAEDMDKDIGDTSNINIEHWACERKQFFMRRNKADFREGSVLKVWKRRERSLFSLFQVQSEAGIGIYGNFSKY